MAEKATDTHSIERLVHCADEILQAVARESPKRTSIVALLATMRERVGRLKFRADELQSAFQPPRQACLPFADPITAVAEPQAAD